jgi:hypothetical protein
MIRAIILLAFLLCAPGAHAQTRPCEHATGFKHLIPTGPVEIVPAIAGQRIYYCGFTILQKGNTLDLIVMAGQGTNCDTNTVQLTPQLELPNDFALSNRVESVGPATEPGYALCIQTLGTNAKLGGLIYWSQF